MRRRRWGCRRWGRPWRLRGSEGDVWEWQNRGSMEALTMGVGGAGSCRQFDLEIQAHGVAASMQM